MSDMIKAAIQPSETSDYSGQTVLISNVDDEAGADIARYFASAGAVVGLCGADQAALEMLAGEIGARGGQARLAAIPLAGSEKLAEAIDRACGEFGKIDVLLNNTGELPGRALADLSVNDFEKNNEALLTRLFAFMREVVPEMRRRRYGRIVNVYGLAYLGLPAHVNLAAAYAGIFGLTRAVALETAADGITVNSVVKGDIARANVPADDTERLSSRVPVRRLGTTADIVHAVKYFASTTSSYVTGQTLFVCGGKSAYFSLSV